MRSVQQQRVQGTTISRWNKQLNSLRHVWQPHSTQKTSLLKPANLYLVVLCMVCKSELLKAKLSRSKLDQDQ